jgi:hypothetical protein
MFQQNMDSVQYSGDKNLCKAPQTVTFYRPRKRSRPSKIHQTLLTGAGPTLQATGTRATSDPSRGALPGGASELPSGF